MGTDILALDLDLENLLRGTILYGVAFSEPTRRELQDMMSAKLLSLARLKGEAWRSRVAWIGTGQLGYSMTTYTGSDLTSYSTDISVTMSLWAVESSSQRHLWKFSRGYFYMYRVERHV